MKKIKFNGARRYGTLEPRMMWSLDQVLDVEDHVAEKLLSQPGFELVKLRRRRVAEPRDGAKDSPEEE